VTVRVPVLGEVTVIGKGAVGAGPFVVAVKLIGIVIEVRGVIVTFVMPVTAYGEISVGHITVNTPRPAFLIVKLVVAAEPPAGACRTRAAGAINRPARPVPLRVTLNVGVFGSLLSIVTIALLVRLVVLGVKVIVSVILPRGAILIGPSDEMVKEDGVVTVMFPRRLPVLPMFRITRLRVVV